MTAQQELYKKLETLRSKPEVTDREWEELKVLIAIQTFDVLSGVHQLLEKLPNALKRPADQTPADGS